LVFERGDIMKTNRFLAFAIAAIMVMSLLFINSLAADDGIFIDVANDHPYKDEIEFCYQKGFILGVGPNLFDPDGGLTRAHLATIWCRTLYVDEANHTFTDIPRLSNYYDTPAIVLNSLGIMKGISPTEFAPHNVLTREQLALITMRTYKLGVANNEAYMRYADHASISEWAREGINACLNAEVFEGLYDGENFEPQKTVTRAEASKLVYNIMSPKYTITIAETPGGKITASHNEARPGTLITLTITPDEGKRLKAGTLKYDDVVIEGRTFRMPAKDIVITAEFEDKPVLESIAVTTPPDKTAYTVGETLDLTGMVVTATYSDDSTAVVTEYTTTPAAGSVLETEGTVTVTVSYTEDNITKTTTFDVQVSATSTEPNEPGGNEPEEPGNGENEPGTNGNGTNENGTNEPEGPGNGTGE